MSANPTFVTVPRGKPVNLVLADGTTKKTVLTAGASGYKLTALHVSCPQAGTMTVSYRNATGPVDSVINALSYVANVGTGGTLPPVSLLDNILTLAVDNDGQRYLFVEAGDSIVVNLLAALTGTNTASVIPTGGDF